MRIKKVWKNIIFSLLFLALIPVAIMLLIRFAPVPPEGEVEYARLILSQAASNGAATYSKKLYHEATALYDSAMTNWQKENKRFIYFRNYERVAGFAELSAKKAEEAMKYSISSASDLNIKLKHQIDSLNHLVGQINKLFASYPLSADLWSRISKGKMLLKESEIAYKRGHLVQANRKITDAEPLLTDSYESATTHMKEYFSSFPLWKSWVDKTIRQSKQNKDYSIIIDKFSRKCFVYYSGVKKYEYNIELGKNWVGDKRVKGDQATPEGMYRIIKKFGSNKTKYYKALLIDYPNDTDKKEFKQEIASGTLPRSARIGSLIEIHGAGGRGVDWTEGCIALTNSEMDVVFKIAREGTPVTIVGSTVNLDQFLD